MKKNNHGSDWFLTVLGIGFVGIGFAAHQNETLATLAYLLIGLGCGIFGHFSGKLMKWYAVKDHEELVKQMEIEAKDERNLLIAEKSKAKAYDLMTSLCFHASRIRLDGCRSSGSSLYRCDLSCLAGLRSVLAFCIQQKDVKRVG